MYIYTLTSIYHSKISPLGLHMQSWTQIFKFRSCILDFWDSQSKILEKMIVLEGRFKILVKIGQFRQITTLNQHLWLKILNWRYLDLQSSKLNSLTCKKMVFFTPVMSIFLHSSTSNGTIYNLLVVFIILVLKCN